MSRIRETCGCGSGITIKHRDPEPIAANWRAGHPCDRRGMEREVTAASTAEIAYTTPHRTDSDVLGFHRDDDTEPILRPPATRRDLRQVNL